jgi:hypothetical protein
MAKMWKKGRGKLGFLQPLLGRWVAEADSEMGRVRCTREFKPILGGAFVQLEACWTFESGGAKAPRAYDEVAIIGPGDDGEVRFWSFTSDGKRSEGRLSNAGDLHSEAVGFEAKMPAGLARMAYWPSEHGFSWVVESKTKKGWNRFVEHLYRPA